MQFRLCLVQNGQARILKLGKVRNLRLGIGWVRLGLGQVRSDMSQVRLDLVQVRIVRIETYMQEKLKMLSQSRIVSLRYVMLGLGQVRYGLGQFRLPLGENGKVRIVMLEKVRNVKLGFSCQFRLGIGCVGLVLGYVAYRLGQVTLWLVWLGQVSNVSLD